jgi:hypothetical protein
VIGTLVINPEKAARQLRNLTEQKPQNIAAVIIASTGRNA